MARGFSYPHSQTSLIFILPFEFVITATENMGQALLGVGVRVLVQMVHVLTAYLIVACFNYCTIALGAVVVACSNWQSLCASCR